MIRCIKRSIPAIVSSLLISAVYAQDFPAKTVRVVVPYPAGGITDTVGRLLAQKLNENWRQPVILENRAGAGGNVGSEQVARAAPDGYTLLVNSGPTMVISKALYPKLGYDPLKDLAPISQIIVLPNILVVHPSIPVKSVKELIALARAHPGKLTFASAGPGTVGHLAGEMFKSMAQVDMVHVPYKGAAPAITDLVGGQVALFFDTITSALPHAKAGRLRLLAVSSAKGSALLPDVPTVSSQGLAGFDANPSFGAFAPGGTSKAMIARLNADIVRAASAADVRSRLESQGAEVLPDTPERFGAYLEEESQKWSKVIRAAKLKFE